MPILTDIRIYIYIYVYTFFDQILLVDCSFRVVAWHAYSMVLTRASLQIIVEFARTVALAAVAVHLPGLAHRDRAVESANVVGCHAALFERQHCSGVVARCGGHAGARVCDSLLQRLEAGTGRGLVRRSHGG